MKKQKILLVISITLIGLIIFFFLPQKLFNNLRNPSVTTVQYETTLTSYNTNSQVSISPTMEERILRCLKSSALRRTFMYRVPTTSSNTYLHMVVQDEKQRIDIHFFDNRSYVISNKVPFIYQFTEEEKIYNELLSLLKEDG